MSSTVTPREGEYTGEVFNQTENAISTYLDLSLRNIPQVPLAHIIGSGQNAASGAGDFPRTKLEEILLRSAPAPQLVSSTHPRALTVRQGLTNCFHPKSGLVITTASLAGRAGYQGNTHALSLKPLTKPAVAGGGGQTMPVELPMEVLSVGSERLKKSVRGVAGPQVGSDNEQCEVGSTACGSCKAHPTGRSLAPSDILHLSPLQAQQLDHSNQHPRPSPVQGTPPVQGSPPVQGTSPTPPLPDHSLKSPGKMV